ncbi:MAG: hypothetical protein OEV44_04960 [Spirochaetota bacterium]|nr:hypothetical protein [Spirochaetota bacterium]
MIGDKIIKDIRSGVARKYNFSKEVDDIEYFIQIEDFDRFSLVLKEIGFKNIKSNNSVDLNEFKNKVQRLEDKLSYFIELPKLYEINKNELVSQLRSNPSEGQSGAINYYEILFSKGNRIKFYRISNQKGNKEKINMVIPDNILIRLLNDFSETLKI